MHRTWIERTTYRVAGRSVTTKPLHPQIACKLYCNIYIWLESLVFGFRLDPERFWNVTYLSALQWLDLERFLNVTYWFALELDWLDPEHSWNVTYWFALNQGCQVLPTPG